MGSPGAASRLLATGYDTALVCIDYLSSFVMSIAVIQSGWMVHMIGDV